jgi:hypothetical protein
METSKPTTSRREMLSKTILASMALSIGLLGMNDDASAKSNRKTRKGISPVLSDNPPKWDDVKKKYFKKHVDFTLTNRADAGPQNYDDALKDLRHQMITRMTALGGVARTADGTTFASKHLRRIESQLSSTTARDAQALNTTFLNTHADILLNQATDLLERALSDRAKWDDMSIKNLMQMIDLSQFVELDNIHQQEITHQFNAVNNGCYEQNFNLAQSQYDTELLNNTALNAAVQFYNDFFSNKWSEDVMGKIIANYSEAVTLEHTSNAATIASDYTNVFSNTIANQHASNMIEQNSLNDSLQESTRRLSELKSTLDWETVNKDFQFQRSNVYRKYQYMRIASNSDADGILNYNKRLAPILQRFQEDFNNALARLQVAWKGLDDIFGYTTVFPNLDDKLNLFDNCVAWSRAAINFYNRFSRLDQSYVLPVSLRNIMEKKLKTSFTTSEDQVIDNDLTNAWNKAINSGKITFNIDDSFFPDQRHVRVKGLNIFFILVPYKRHPFNLERVNGCILADVDAPLNSQYVHLDEKTVPVDQSNIPSLRMGRLGTRNFIRTPETGGTSIFYNISPFGDWTIQLPQIAQPSGDAKLNELVYIADIYVDLVVTVRKKS